MVVVENGGKVTGLVVLIKNLFSGWACTSHLDWVAQHTAFQDLEILSGLGFVNEVHYHIGNSGA